MHDVYSSYSSTHNDILCDISEVNYTVEQGKKVLPELYTKYRQVKSQQCVTRRHSQVS